MLRKAFVLAAAVTVLSLLTSAKAQAWGGFHVGYTHVGYGGVQHWGRTAFAGPGGYHYGGSYHYGGYGGYGGYRYGGGYHYGGYGGLGYGDAYRAGYYRRW